MGWATALATLFLIWWITLFAILPLRVERDGGRDGRNPLGHQSGAPAQPLLRWKMRVTTIVALAVWGIVLVIDQLDLFTPEDIPRWLGLTPG